MKLWGLCRALQFFYTVQSFSTARLSTMTRKSVIFYHTLFYNILPEPTLVSPVCEMRMIGDSRLEPALWSIIPTLEGQSDPGK
jgi:hypothetical protein